MAFAGIARREQVRTAWRAACSLADVSRMRWELAHVFIATPDRGLEAVASAFGLTFTSRRVHQGQGTANSCAVFENAFFELLFPGTPEELESEVVRPLGLKERINWQTTGACPFGVCFRLLADLSRVLVQHRQCLLAGVEIAAYHPHLGLLRPEHCAVNTAQSTRAVARPTSL
jgi:Glyoxalase-like domain